MAAGYCRQNVACGPNDKRAMLSAGMAEHIASRNMLAGGATEPRAQHDIPHKEVQWSRINEARSAQYGAGCKLSYPPSYRNNNCRNPNADLLLLCNASICPALG